MKSFLLVTGLVLLLGNAKAQDAVQQHLEKTDDGYKLTLAFNNVAVDPAGGNWYTPDVKGAAHTLEKGAPQMPYMAYSFLVGGDMELVVTGSSYTDYFGYDVIPSKGNLSRADDPSKISPVAGAVYQQDAFYPSKIVSKAGDYMIRSAHGQAVHVYPVQYNPVTHLLRIYHSIEVAVKTPEAQKPVEVATNALWDNIYKKQFLNYHLLEGAAAKSTYSAPAETGDMLIITPTPYIADLQEFIKWKAERGIRCLVMAVDTMTSGPDPDSIRARISWYYQQYGINYVVLIGDIGDMPPVNDNTVGGPSDAAYTYISGNDHYPDLLIGRFSANTWNELVPQLTKSIEYEKNPPAAQGWYGRAIGIASDEGPGDDNEMDWEHMAGIRTQLLGATYTHVDEAYDGTHDPNIAPLDLPGDPNASAVISAVNTGISLLNYCGHGSSTSMATTNFGNANVAQLNNTGGQWPFMLTVACVTGEFTNNTSLGERLMRANIAGQPTGMVAGFMSSINQSWDPPMEAQDEFNSIITNNNSNQLYAAGAITTASCMAMNDAYGSAGDEMTDTWIFFGDPSLQLRYDSSEVLTAQHVGSIYSGETTLNVQLNKNYATVVLLHADTIYSVEQTSTASTAHNFASLPAGDSLVVVATAPNTNPYHGKVYVISDPVGVGNVATVPAVSIYPNPANNTVYVRGLEEKSTYRCLDIAGRVVLMGDITNADNSIDVKELASGSYILQIGPKAGKTSLPMQVLR